MDKNIKKLQGVHLRQTTPLRLAVWNVRRGLRNITGKDILDTSDKPKPHRERLRRIYLKLDDLLIKHLPNLQRATPRAAAMKRVRDMLEHELNYHFHEVDIKRPWGGYFRVSSKQVDKFLDDFFPGLDKAEARLGRERAELSPKIMVFLPGKRISWQYHERRAERWHLLTPGIYYRSMGDELPKPIQAKVGEIVQFAQGERHRGGAPADSYVLIAEIWQHTDSNHLSNEADVFRLEDDFKRPKHPKLT